MKEVKIKINCDEGHTADFLRQLANEIENSETETTVFETFHGIAEVN